ncbi:MAG: type II toxin-antitoxin system MqsA family antitoxin [Bacteroidales bacterium]|nr:type II toxin-antitoxin system MqsA family antitoxin [Bacteroidales bacterium]
MECGICKNGKTKQGFVTFTLERKNVIVVFKNVPALVCENCGDFYLTEETTKLLLEKASKTLEKGVEFEIINLKYAA